MKHKIINLIVLTIILLFIPSRQAFASTYSNAEKSAELVDSLAAFEEEFASIEFNPDSEMNMYSDRTVQDITIPLVGMSSFISFDWERFNITEENYRDFICNEIEYYTDNVDVAVAFDGRILARGIGNAVITVRYQNLVQCFNITVKEELSEDEIGEFFILKSAASRASESAQRDAIVDKARDMVYCVWYPTSDLTGWRNGHTYNANTRQCGIPYTQAYNGQCNNEEFISAMSKSDFYNTYYNENGVAMPRYGNDCSAFVAICWGLQYNGIGRYVSGKLYDEFDSIGDYNNLQRGDAVVSRTAGHAFLIVQNWETPPSGASHTISFVTCYEQKPYGAQLTFWTYDKLRTNGYKPISIF